MNAGTSAVLGKAGTEEMSDMMSHILYEWETFTDVEIRGEVRRYSNGPRSLILHRLENPKPNVPENALQTPCYYSSYLDKWLLANGELLELPHKLR